MSDFISMMSLNNQIIFIDREPCVKAESRDGGSGEGVGQERRTPPPQLDIFYICFSCQELFTHYIKDFGPALLLAPRQTLQAAPPPSDSDLATSLQSSLRNEIIKHH